jgi:uncharacterized membrane protein
MGSAYSYVVLVLVLVVVYLVDTLDNEKMYNKNNCNNNDNDFFSLDEFHSQ